MSSTKTSPDPSRGLSCALRAELRCIAGPGRLLTDPADCWPYGYDNSRRHVLPQAVVYASDRDQIAALVRCCAEHGLPLTARGRGTGTTGATVPDRGGVVLSFERMARILRIAPDDRIAVVEPGVVNDRLQTALADKGFFWPPDPSSGSVCTIGGNLACNAAGPRAVKYGTARENTLGLEAVTGCGEPMRTGVLTTKGVVGYDLTRLLIGSEGTLAVITEATLRITPLPEARRTLRALYRDIQSAANAVAVIMAQPVVPCALELMDAAAIAAVREHGAPGLPDACGALLMIELDGTAACIADAARVLQAAADNGGLLGIVGAKSADEAAGLWCTRRALAPALRGLAPSRINEDVVVPVSRLGALISGLARLSSETGIRIVNFGHAGNGNIHVNLLVDPSDGEEMRRAEVCLEAVFSLVLELGGTLSGEHGVGLDKREFVGREIDPHALALMRAIKRQFDPAGILNPGKGLPPSGR